MRPGKLASLYEAARTVFPGKKPFVAPRNETARLTESECYVQSTIPADLTAFGGTCLAL